MRRREPHPHPGPGRSREPRRGTGARARPAGRGRTAGSPETRRRPRRAPHRRDIRRHLGDLRHPGRRPRHLLGLSHLRSLSNHSHLRSLSPLHGLRRLWRLRHLRHPRRHRRGCRRGWPRWCLHPAPRLSLRLPPLRLRPPLRRRRPSGPHRFLHRLPRDRRVRRRRRMAPTVPRTGAVPTPGRRRAVTALRRASRAGRATRFPSRTARTPTRRTTRPVPVPNRATCPRCCAPLRRTRIRMEAAPVGRPFHRSGLRRRSRLRQRDRHRHGDQDQDRRRLPPRSRPRSAMPRFPRPVRCPMRRLPWLRPSPPRPSAGAMAGAGPGGRCGAGTGRRARSGCAGCFRRLSSWSRWRVARGRSSLTTRPSG